MFRIFRTAVKSIQELTALWKRREKLKKLNQVEGKCSDYTWFAIYVLYNLWFWLPYYFLALLPVPQHRIPQLSQDGRLQLIVHHYRKQLYEHILVRPLSCRATDYTPEEMTAKSIEEVRKCCLSFVCFCWFICSSAIWLWCTQSTPHIRSGNNSIPTHLPQLQSADTAPFRSIIWRLAFDLLFVL